MEGPGQEWGEYYLDADFGAFASNEQLLDYDSQFLDAVSSAGFGPFQPADTAQAGDDPCSTLDGYQFHQQYNLQYDQQYDPSCGSGYVHGHDEGSFSETYYNPPAPMGNEEPGSSL